MFRKIILASALPLLTACGDPLGGVDRLADLDIAATDNPPAALPTDAEVAREGFFGTPAAAAPARLPETAPKVSDVTPKPKRKGLLRLLRRDAPAMTNSVPTTDQPPAEDGQAEAIASAVATSRSELPQSVPPVEGGTEEAALAPQSQTTPAPATPKRRGLFARKPAADVVPTGPDARDVPFGTILPYGTIARSCEAKGKRLGRRVEKAGARGFALHDSNPASEGARTWYITGFSDGCPRQLTAANALLGSASLYETLHYGPGGENLPTGETDKAYERIKRKVCGTRRGKPCGSKINQMDKSTFFVTAYQRFGNSSRWAEVLVHDGAVIAAVIKPDG